MNRATNFVAAWLVLGFIAQTDAAEPNPGPQIDFRQQIQPLLARDCYACHGPDENTREAGLRLDVEEAAKSHAIVEGDSTSSELIDRIFSDDPDTIMPPPETGHTLLPAEKTLLKQWIDQGAKWQNHWAFESIRSPDVPKVKSDWPANPIDHFVLTRLEQHNLQPSRVADKATLLRRVTLDLTGLPPTPAEWTAFREDPSDDGFENVVDRLLDSPHYGEQMAIAWLDAARYADTNGYQNDFVRTMWPWRDWVIDAFNRNLPYNEFIIHQIAGDLLPSPTDEQIIATGFNRNNRTVTESGSIEAEWQVENCVDRVETTSGALLGLTMGCARCHDHKYDPISQKEFYQFLAFFNNTQDKGFYNEQRGNVGPTIAVVPPETRQRLQHLATQITELKETIASKTPSVTELAAWIDPWRLQWDETDAVGPVFNTEKASTSLATAVAPAGPGWEFVGTNDPVDVPPLPFEIDTGTPFTWSAWVRSDSRGAIFGKMNEADSYRGIDGLILEDGRLKVHLIHRWTTDAIAVVTDPPLTTQGWTFVAVAYDGSSKANGLKVSFDGQPVSLHVEQDRLSGTLVTDVPLKIGQRNVSSHLRGSVAGFQITARALSQPEIGSLIRRSILKAYDAATRDPSNSPNRVEEVEGVQNAASASLLQTIANYLPRLEHHEEQRQLAELQNQYAELEKSKTTTMVMREQEGEYRETYLLRRGQYDLPEKESGALYPQIPAVLPALTDDQPTNRLGLARWMTDDRNPLVARVAVNRAWMHFWGRGLVSSVDNFGIQGAPPTHPELMDWLADDFRRSGWDLKRLHKMIVMSATYQQASARTTESNQSDPENVWMARGPRYRISAESIRDQALAVSGLLARKIGGPAVFPYQPPRLWDELAGGANNGPYQQSTGEDLYRRSLYTYRKRTVSHPTLSTFGAPTWEICQFYRAQTNTPLQSLALLNDITYVEAARKLAERMWKETRSNDAVDAIRHGFELTHFRAPTDSEFATLQSGFEQYLTYYSEHPDDAGRLLAVGDSEHDESLPAERLAAMTSVATVLLNRDEVITKQ